MTSLGAKAASFAWALCLLALVAGAPFDRPLAQGTSEAVDPTALRVCADPGNLPFSNEAEEGFENKIAELLAAELGVPVRYTWYPQATGFVRNTLGARRCDLVMGVSLGFELLQNTNPYYRSSYVMVYRSDSGITARSLDDPALKERAIGVVAGTPPATVMVKYGLIDKARPYHLMVDARFERPGEQMIHDIETGEIDAGLLWGPIAGYYARKAGTPMTLVPLKKGPGDPEMSYRITMGVRYGEQNWKHQVNELIAAKQQQINEILLDYGVPLIDNQGRPIER